MKNCKPYHKPKNANTEAATARTIPPSLLHPVEKNKGSNNVAAVLYLFIVFSIFNF